MAVDRHARRLPPPWLGHLLVFGLLIAMVVVWFFYQTREAQRSFLEDAAEHARLLADAVALHARGAVLAQDVTDAILVSFLGSTGRFVDYLDAVEPFHADELAAFAAEAGLSVIRVQRAGEPVQGPAAWAAPENLGCETLLRLIRLPALHTVLFGVPREGGPGCVLVGMDSHSIESLQAAISLPRALEAVAGLPGVVEVALQGVPDAELARRNGTGTPEVAIRRAPGGRQVAQARTPVAGAELVLDMDAGPLLRQRERLWLEFAGLLLVLSLVGGLGTWLLYRHQRAHDRELLAYERRLSQQREEAGLGRAAAAIAHEIRNPLNAIAMGLQRLQMEADELDDEHRRLVSVVLEAVRRTNGTVTGLMDYARPYHPRREPVALGPLIDDRLSLYGQRLRELDVVIDRDLPGDVSVSGDPDLLRRLLDNLLSNALEAVPVGGHLAIALSRRRDAVRLVMINEGLSLREDEVTKILEPWFTTRTEGTGLGLAICRRIVESHGGRLAVDVPQEGRLRVLVSLPA